MKKKLRFSYNSKQIKKASKFLWKTNPVYQNSNDTHLIPKIFEAKETKNTFVINGVEFDTLDGTCVRDYVHVSDLALAHASACDQMLANNVCWRINLGTQEGISNLQMVNTFTDIVGDIDTKFGPTRDGDPASLVASNSLAKQKLNWSPVYSDVEILISSTQTWYKRKVNDV